MIGKLWAGRSYLWFAVKLGRALGEVPCGAYRGSGTVWYCTCDLGSGVKSLRTGPGGDTNLRKVALPWRSALEFSVTVERLRNDQKAVQFKKTNKQTKKNIYVYAHTTSGFEFSVAKAYQGSETEWVNNCLCLQEKNKPAVTCRLITWGVVWERGSCLLLAHTSRAGSRAVCVVWGVLWGRWGAGGMWRRAAENLAGLVGMRCVERLREMGLFNLR